MELNRSYRTKWGSAVRTGRQAQERADLAGRWARSASVFATTVRRPATPKPIARTRMAHRNVRTCLELNSITTKYVRRGRCGPATRAPRARGTFLNAGP